MNLINEEIKKYNTSIMVKGYSVKVLLGNFEQESYRIFLDKEKAIEFAESKIPGVIDEVNEVEVII